MTRLALTRRAALAAFPLLAASAASAAGASARVAGEADSPFLAAVKAAAARGEGGFRDLDAFGHALLRMPADFETGARAIIIGFAVDCCAYVSRLPVSDLLAGVDPTEGDDDPSFHPGKGLPPLAWNGTPVRGLPAW
jgi:hypothetical protein